MNWQEFTALLVLATAMSFSPGPNNTLSATLAANYGLRRAMPFVASVPMGWGLMLGLCALGLGALLVAAPLLGQAIKFAGAAYLVWLAWKIARAGRPAGASGAGEAAPPANVGFWQGAAFQFVNIKAWMFALAIVSGWIAGRADPGLRFALVLPVMLFFAFASNLTYALLGSLLREWLAGPAQSGQRMVWFNRLMAAVLLATAVWMLWQ
ncbi:MAG: lysine transporter LysE [Polaromonas sp. 39-63-203]|uniref:LysE family translocator n=1 Tax=Polaromonas sp. TaxID=1869339 RepID=UPI000BDC9F3E|nr:LysE family translocator [Polaromonas sp.]OYY53941.1 MAG: lysine transporter LysE [Polaromonas sp. 35-63-240]OYZ03393.1 MAG: lysine transporter LysE [Polaromonas sp. 28-63-22]OYZ84975.1 MAG: lysine transporter LysE [Polaromonas sp. 24-62-144]OZB00176.1 MAG: lysine transporter LysE [Polaromonas sp. 39-63-203]HQS31631.1 LysE family translocator [Polaromonas sp.]